MKNATANIKYSLRSRLETSQMFQIFHLGFEDADVITRFAENTIPNLVKLVPLVEGIKDLERNLALIAFYIDESAKNQFDLTTMEHTEREKIREQKYKRPESRKEEKMAATKQDIERWFKEGVRKKQDFMIVVCDTFDWEDYPVYTKGLSEFTEKHEEFDGSNLQQIMEVYDLHLPMAKQMAEYRAFHFPKDFAR